MQRSDKLFSLDCAVVKHDFSRPFFFIFVGCIAR